MINMQRIGVAAAVLVATASITQAGLFDSVDGTINTGEYAVGSTDSGDGGTVFANGNLDIDRVQFRFEEIDGTLGAFMGFNVMGGDFDLGSAVNPTTVTVFLFDDTNALQYKLDLMFQGSDDVFNATLVDENFQPITVDPGDVDLETTPGGDFELGLDASIIDEIVGTGSTTTFGFSLRVGDLFGTHVDQHADSLTLAVPEPATLALFGLGGLLIVRRRR